MSVLDRIVRRKAKEVAAREADTPRAKLEQDLAPSDRSFIASLTQPGMSLIAEIKRRSPSRGLIRSEFDLEAVARTYERSASAISVLTDEKDFGGHPSFLARARAVTTRPLLAKDFVLGPYQVAEARKNGADAVLLMCSVLDDATLAECLALAHALSMDALVETHDGEEMRRALDTEARIVGVNSRNLKTLQIDPRTVLALAPKARAAGKVVVAESGIFARSDVDRFREVADAVLIGTALMCAPDIGDKIAELGW